MNKKSEIILLIIILLFAFFIRIYALGNAPFWIDESISSIASENILEKGLPTFDSGALYDRAYVKAYFCQILSKKQAIFVNFKNNRNL